ncbi:MAG: winged helix-turn-helix domain-containing protein [Dehalococcoidia bacterium]|nr:winged helix-turn-helix domain-containing protein [Dehalococcoidia bacterium]
MRTRRTSIDIVAEILRLKTAGKTQIMYGARLSHTQLEKYLRFLLENGFLQLERKLGRSRYRTTAKGEKLLGDIETIQTMMEADSSGPYHLAEQFRVLEDPRNDTVASSERIGRRDLSG